MIRINHRDIAAQLSLSQSTVSRGLRDDPSIPIATRKRIKAVAKKMGYQPNILMSEMASNRWQRAHVAKGNVIAYIDTIGREKATYIGGADITRDLNEQASLLGYQLVPFQRNHFSSSAKLQRVLRSRGITDVILGAIYEKSLMVDLDWNKFICVQVSPGLYRLPLHSVTKDPFNTVVLAWQKAVGYGYRRVGIVLLKHTVQIMDDILRNSAVYACQNDLFGHLPRLTPFHYEMKDHRVEDFMRWIKTNQPDVIIGFSASHYNIFRSELGATIPFITLHKIGDHFFAGIPEPAAECAREAVNLIHFCRRTHQWGIPQQRIDHVIEPSWVDGESLPRRSRP